MSLTEKQRSRLLLAIIYLGFISLGLPDTILGVTWNSMYLPSQLNKPLYYVSIVTTVLLLCSTISSFSSGAILRRLGTGKLLIVCGSITALSMLASSIVPAFIFLVIIAVPLGFGQGAIDTGMNFYVAKHYTSRDMSWLHCCWGIGASSGPAIASWIIVGGGSWRWAYVALGAIQVVLTLLFFSSRKLWGTVGKDAAGSTDQEFSGKTVYSSRFTLCALSFFFYTGTEITVGLWGYAFLTKCSGVSETVAGFCVAGYWGSLTLGRFILGMVSNRLGARRLNFYSFIGVIISGVLMALPLTGFAAILPLFLLGFSLASIYPGMMHLAPSRFDDSTAATLTGFQGGAAMLGSIAVPAAMGYFGVKWSFELLPYVVLVQAAIVMTMQLKVDCWQIGKNKA